jgi:protoporphyrinogen oxidase
MLPASTETLIIGAGLAGLSTALHLGGDAVILEAEEHVGGKACSEVIEGFTFDVTGHWLHLRDEGIRKLVFDLLGEGAFHRIERISRIWSHGVYTEYPFQANTYGLPPEVVKECVMGAIEADRRRPAEVRPEDEPLNFADWIRFYFGEGIARHFMVPYNAKLWGVPAEEITSRWCQRFVPKPRLEEIVGGAVGCNARKMGYNATFLYPKNGGIRTVADAIAGAVGHDRIHLGRRVESIDLDQRVARTTDGASIKFRHLVNTMPLPELMRRLEGVPSAVRDATGRLRATSVTYLNVGVDGPLGVPDHWIYVPEQEWPMYRVGSFSNAVPEMAPPGMSSLYIELSDRDTPPEQLAPRVQEGLVAMGIIDDPRRLLFAHPRRVPHAYVIYDFHYHSSRQAVHDWLQGRGVLSIGRYGDWNYSSMEDALIDGRRAATRLSGCDAEALP